MTGLEYVLLHVQEPILYVIRKQHRHTSQQVTPLADYYIIAGVVYQAPDLASVLNSRLVDFVKYPIYYFHNYLNYSYQLYIIYNHHLKNLQGLQDIIQAKATLGTSNHKGQMLIKPKRKKNQKKNQVLYSKGKELICF